MIDVDPLAKELGERFARRRVRAVPGRRGRARRDARPAPRPTWTSRRRRSRTRRPGCCRAGPTTATTCGVRFGTVGALQGRRSCFEITTFREEVYAGGAPQAGGDVREGHRDRPVAARLHDQRDGACGCPDGDVRRSVRRASGTSPRRRSTRRSSPRSPSPTTRCGCCGPRGSSSQLDVAPGRPRGRGDRATCASGSTIVSRRADPRRARQAARAAPDPSAGLRCWSSTPGLSDEFLPELSALQLEQDPVHRHKDVLRHTYAVVERCEPDLRAAARRAAARHRQAEDARRSRPMACSSTITRSWARGWREARLQRAALPERDDRRRPQAGRAAPAVPRVRRRAGPTAPSAATCATPARCSTG